MVRVSRSTKPQKGALALGCAGDLVVGEAATAVAIDQCGGAMLPVASLQALQLANRQVEKLSGASIGKSPVPKWLRTRRRRCSNAVKVILPPDMVARITEPLGGDGVSEPTTEGMPVIDISFVPNYGGTLDLARRELVRGAAIDGSRNCRQCWYMPFPGGVAIAAPRYMLSKSLPPCIARLAVDSSGVAGGPRRWRVEAHQDTAREQREYAMSRPRA